MKLLMIEDDEFIAHTLTTVLTSQNYAVEVATDGQAGWELVEAFDYDLVLLDVMLPKLDGIRLCRQIRSKGLQMPILLLTGRDSSHDKAIGLDAGADDYVVKPFDPEELVARVRALLRRGRAVSQPILAWGDLRLDPSSYEVTYGTRTLSLTPKEYALLELFLRNSRRVFSCGLILEHLWAYEEMPGEEAVRTHIKGLRQKLKAAGVPSDVIETVYGIGYRLKPEEKAEGRGQKAEGNGQTAEGRGQKVENAETGGDGDATPTPFSNTAHRTADRQLPVASRADRDALAKINQPTQQQTLASVNQIWQRFKQRVSEQVGVLERSVIALEQQELDPDLRQQARHEAHTLAGSLGTFGLPEGSHLARQIEQLLQAEPLGQAEALNLRQWVVALRQEVERSRRVSEAESGSPSPETSLETLHPSTSTEDLTSTEDPTLAEDHRPLLLIVDRDRPLVQTLVAEATTRGFRAAVAADLTRARDKIFLASPDVVLLDPAVSPIAAESLSLLTDLSKQVPPIPVVIWTEHNDLTERLEVARLGGRTFLQKSLPPAQVLEAVDQVLHQADRAKASVAKASVMVVDDDPALLSIVRSLLEPWGLKITTLGNPQQFWQVLEATLPDLLILDIEMPQIGGIELCQIVRNDSRWGNLPILFLTAHSNADMVNRVFSVGADDFVSKPIVGPELVTRIINRLERIRFSRIACGRD